LVQRELESGRSLVASIPPVPAEPPSPDEEVDAGADIIVMHGAPLLHGVEIYHGRPIFYDLGNFIYNLPPTLTYEPGVIVADGDFVIVHGRFSGFGRPANWIAADILRIERGVLVEHWDVIQDEATREQSKSGLPMFGDHFPR